jgi:hypothetical protein
LRIIALSISFFNKSGPPVIDGSSSPAGGIVEARTFGIGGIFDARSKAKGKRIKESPGVASR